MTRKPKLTALERDELFALVDAVQDAAYEHSKALHGPFVPGRLPSTCRARTDTYMTLIRWVYERADLGPAPDAMPGAGSGSGSEVAA